MSSSSVAVRVWMRQERSSSLILLRASLLTAGRNSSEHAGSVPGRGFPGTEGIAQERERGRTVVTLAALAVLAVHDPGLIRVQLQPDLRHPLLQRGEDF